MKKLLQLLIVIGIFAFNQVCAQTYSDTLSFGWSDPKEVSYPMTDWSAKTGDSFPFTQQFIFKADETSAASPNYVDSDVTLTVTGNKFDPSTGEIIDSTMYVNRFQTYRLSFGAYPDGENDAVVPNGDQRQFNHDEVLTFVFDKVDNKPPSVLYPDVQMNLVAIGGWGRNVDVKQNIVLNGELVGIFKVSRGLNVNIDPILTDPITNEPTKITIKEGDTLQIWGTPLTFYRFNSLIMVMEATVPAAELTLTPEGDVAEITELGGTLRIFSEVLPENTSNKRVIWSIEDNGTGATINQGGLIQANPRNSGNGTVKVTAKLAEADISQSIDITITGQEDVLVESIEVYSHTDSIVTNGGTLRIRATVLPEIAPNREVEWSIEDNGTGTTIDSLGLVRASARDHGNGVVTVKAAAKDGSGVFGTKEVYIVNQESVFVESITITHEGDFPEITENEGILQLFAEVVPLIASERTVDWSIENYGTGTTIDDNGLVKASGTNEGNGMVTVTALAKDGSGVYATIDVFIAGQFSTVSVPDEAIIKNTILVYPNPIIDDQPIIIETGDKMAFIKEIIMYDVVGRKILYKTGFTESTLRTELYVNLEGGIYFIQINTNKGSVVKRIIKSN